MNLSDRTETGVAVLITGLALGILADALLRVGPWGLNLLLWIGGLAAALALLTWRCGRTRPKHEGGLITVAALCAAAFVWHDSPVLHLLAAFGIVVALGLMALPTQEKRFRLAGITEYILEGMAAALYALCGLPLLLFGDIEWKEVARGGGWRRVIAAGRGILLALPMLIISAAFSWLRMRSSKGLFTRSSTITSMICSFMSLSPASSPG